MAVYAICGRCGTRRDAAKPGAPECSDKSAHKRDVRWTADVQFSRASADRHRKTFNTRELADIQERQWHTDFERGQLLPKAPVSMPFEKVADEWWTMVAVGQNKIKNQNRTERSRVNLWREKFGDRTLATITLTEVEEWVAERRENGIAINTINRDLKPLRWILDYAVTKKYLQATPLKDLKALKGGNIHDRWMTREEVVRLVQAAVDLGDIKLVEFIAVGVNTGFRLGNLERLTARDIQGGLIMAKKTKSGKDYSVPISPDIEPLLHRLMRENPTGPLLHGRDNNIGARFREAAKNAGLYSDKNDNERVTIHSLRHTYGVLFLKHGGGTIDELKELLGHASITITDKFYARFCPEKKLKLAPSVSVPVPQIQDPILKVI